MKRLIQGGADLFLGKVVPKLTVQCVRTSQGFLRRSILYTIRSENCELVSKDYAWTGRSCPARLTFILDRPLFERI
jgi:hypothetical protein